MENLAEESRDSKVEPANFEIARLCVYIRLCLPLAWDGLGDFRLGFLQLRRDYNGADLKCC